MLSSIAIADLFMQVTEVDAGMLQYQSLEDLTLTGNLLKTVRGEHLPPQLKVGSHGSSTCGPLIGHPVHRVSDGVWLVDVCTLIAFTLLAVWHYHSIIK